MTLLRAIVVVFVCLALAGCNETASSSSSPATTSAGVISRTAAPMATPTSIVQPTTTVTSPPDSGEFEIATEFIDFIAAMDELLGDTEYQGLAEEDPGIFIVTGLLFCEQLSEGVVPSEILTFYVETLTGDHIDKADDDTLVLAGSILGTAVGYLCPEYTDTLEQRL